MVDERRALVTGAAGFCGRHLGAELLHHGFEVHGLDRVAGSDQALRRGQAMPPPTMHLGDICNLAWVGGVVEAVRPTHVFHLAALTIPQVGWEALHDVNVRGTAQLMEAVVHSGCDPVVVLPGSSAAYGAVEPHELPIVESQPFRPASAYAVSKIAQEMLAYTYHVRHGLRLVRARAFNLTGPGESPAFVTSAFARQVAEIEGGLRGPVVEVGNLDAIRDLTDVRDAVRAYRLLAQEGEPGVVYNVCSGYGVTIRSILEGLLALSTASHVRVQLAPERLQAADVPVQFGDASRLWARTGWRPRIPLKQSLVDVLLDWRGLVEGRGPGET